jgi:hypothetical protein
MPTETKSVRVGVAVFALSPENKFILGKRIGSHGAGESPQPLTSIYKVNIEKKYE